MAENSSSRGVDKLIENLDKAINKGFQLLVEYKKSAKEYEENKKALKKNMTNKKKEIDNKLGIIKLKILDAQKSNPKLYMEYGNEEKKLKKLKKLMNETNNDKFLIEIEKIFLKIKEVYRENKIITLDKIKRLFRELKNKMDTKEYKDYVKQLYGTILTDSTNTYSYKIKTIMHYLESGPVTEKAAKLATSLNELKSIKNVTSRKKQIEIEIKKIELKKLIDSIDKNLKSAKMILSKKLSKNNMTNSDVKKLLESTNQESNVQEIIDKYVEKFEKIQHNIKSKENAIAKILSSS